MRSHFPLWLFLAIFFTHPTPVHALKCVDYYKQLGARADKDLAKWSSDRPLLIVTDIWKAQPGGILTYLKEEIRQLQQLGVRVELMEPSQFPHLALGPRLNNARIPWVTGAALGKKLKEMNPRAIHIVTEGVLGMRVSHYLDKAGIPYTTAYHTRIPEVAKVAFHIPKAFGKAFVRFFHKNSRKILTPTKAMARELLEAGVTPQKVRPSPHGVDVNLFRPRKFEDLPADLQALVKSRPHPFLLYTGRISVEKNIEAFLNLRTAGTKIVVGDGPELEAYRKKYPEVVFTGWKGHEDTAPYYSIADAFVFPSKTDTFGLVMLEALASGAPVAAFPTPPSKEILSAKSGAIDDDLEKAVQRALALKRENARDRAMTFLWKASALRLLESQVLIP